MKLDWDTITTEDPTTPPNPRLIVRVSTSFWNDHNGLYKKRSIKFLKKKSTFVDGHVIHEDCSMAGAHQVIDGILNLDEVTDGIYELIICNVEYEYCEGGRTGYIDSWNYKLVEYVEDLNS